MTAITANKVASIHYTLKNDEGQILDSSEGQEPLAYLHGAQHLVPGLEKQLEGKTVGDKFHAVVEPEEGYGETDPNLIQELPRTMFGGVDTIEVGMEFHAETQNGPQVVEVIDVEDETVTINGNHPLAGVRLNFDIEITDVRDASEEELATGQLKTSSCCGSDSDCCG